LQAPNATGCRFSVRPLAWLNLGIERRLLGLRVSRAQARYQGSCSSIAQLLAHHGQDVGQTAGQADGTQAQMWVPRKIPGKKKTAGPIRSSRNRTAGRSLGSINDQPFAADIRKLMHRSRILSVAA